MGSKEEILYCEDGERLAQIAQESCSCPILEVSRLDGVCSNLG